MHLLICRFVISPRHWVAQKAQGLSGRASTNSQVRCFQAMASVVASMTSYADRAKTCRKSQLAACDRQRSRL